MMNKLDGIRNFIGKSQAPNFKKSHSESCAVSDLLENPYNRQLDRGKIDKIKTDIKRSGKVLPLVYAEVDHNGAPSKMIVDGHHRFQALKELGYKEVPIVMQDDRGVDTKAPKEEVNKKVERFSIGEKVRFYNKKYYDWDTGQVIYERSNNHYVVRDPDGARHIVSYLDMRKI